LQKAAQTAVAQSGTDTAAIFAELRLAQTAQEVRTNQLATSVQKNIDDGTALLGLVRAQATTLTTLGDTVAKLDQNLSGINQTIAMLLDKVTKLVDGQTAAAEAAAAAAPPTTSTRGRRPAGPPTTNTTEGHEAEKRGRSRSGSQPVAKSIAIPDDGDDEALGSDALRPGTSQ
jgi:uncharacterized coiled-coil protein SlyX